MHYRKKSDEQTEVGIKLKYDSCIIHNSKEIVFLISVSNFLGIIDILTTELNTIITFSS